MGANASKRKTGLKAKDIQELAEKTKCKWTNVYVTCQRYITFCLTTVSEDEIKHWHEGFLKDCPTGKLTKNEFSKIYAQFFPHGNPEAFARFVLCAGLLSLWLCFFSRSFVFNVFDDNGDGSIAFEEFLLALSITSRGNLEDKLECKRRESEKSSFWL